MYLDEAMSSPYLKRKARGICHTCSNPVAVRQLVQGGVVMESRKMSYCARHMKLIPKERKKTAHYMLTCAEPAARRIVQDGKVQQITVLSRCWTCLIQERREYHRKKERL